eukprot:4611627-Amphidinium_carterae.1
MATHFAFGTVGIISDKLGSSPACILTSSVAVNKANPMPADAERWWHTLKQAFLALCTWCFLTYLVLADRGCPKLTMS